MSKTNLPKWETKNKEFIHDFKIFDGYVKTSYHPVWNKESKYALLDSPDWVNICPITKNNEIVLVKQFRHGVDEFTLEIPGGLKEKGEDPRRAAERECLEETGFSAPEDAVYIGKTYPNPAFLNNTCYSYLWTDCEQTREQALEGNEEIEVVKLPVSKLKEYIDDFKIQNSLVLNGIFFFLMKKGLLDE